MSELEKNDDQQMAEIVEGQKKISKQLGDNAIRDIKILAALEDLAKTNTDMSEGIKSMVNGQKKAQKTFDSISGKLNKLGDVNSKLDDLAQGQTEIRETLKSMTPKQEQDAPAKPAQQGKGKQSQHRHKPGESNWDANRPTSMAASPP